MRACGVLRGRGHLRLAQPGQRLLVGGRVRACLGRRQQLVHEGVLQRRIFFVDLLQLGLVGVGEVGAGLHKLLVVVLHQPQRFGIEIERGALLVNRLHPREQLGVQVNCVLVRGQPRRFVLLHLLQIVIGVRAGHAVERSHTRSSNWPERSSATSVFSKVGGAGLLAIASTSSICCAMPASIAGW